MTVKLEDMMKRLFTPLQRVAIRRDAAVLVKRQVAIEGLSAGRAVRGVAQPSRSGC